MAVLCARRGDRPVDAAAWLSSAPPTGRPDEAMSRQGDTPGVDSDPVHMVRAMVRSLESAR